MAQVKNACDIAEASYHPTNTHSSLCLTRAAATPNMLNKHLWPRIFWSRMMALKEFAIQCRLGGCRRWWCLMEAQRSEDHSCWARNRHCKNEGWWQENSFITPRRLHKWENGSTALCRKQRTPSIFSTQIPLWLNPIKRVWDMLKVKGKKYTSTIVEIYGKFIWTCR